MANPELTLDQLESITGGGVFAKLDGINAKNRRVIIPGDMYTPESRGNMLNRRGWDVGPVGLDIGPVN
ncbi:CCRG-2 family RiPP [Synechococcus sp. UW105]|uniref:CCRG-2 family RiPP n=1 Tax=Synechococcus sp. UW105 TaxID=337067 RepID=UPI000E0E3F70|nr:CCRG-2 family RiPP [Synechococcus sp. UW105]